MDRMASVVSVIVGCHNTLMSAEMPLGELHAERLRFFQGQTTFCVFGVKGENEMVLFDVPFLHVLFPASIADLAVNVVCPRCSIDTVDQHVLPQKFDVMFIVNGAGVVVVLEENVSDEIVIIGIMYAQMFQDCH